MLLFAHYVAILLFVSSNIEYQVSRFKYLFILLMMIIQIRATRNLLHSRSCIRDT